MRITFALFSLILITAYNVTYASAKASKLGSSLYVQKDNPRSAMTVGKWMSYSYAPNDQNDPSTPKNNPFSGKVCRIDTFDLKTGKSTNPGPTLLFKSYGKMLSVTTQSHQAYKDVMDALIHKKSQNSTAFKTPRLAAILAFSKLAQSSYMTVNSRKILFNNGKTPNIKWWHTPILKMARKEHLYKDSTTQYIKKTQEKLKKIIYTEDSFDQVIKERPDLSHICEDDTGDISLLIALAHKTLSTNLKKH